MKMPNVKNAALIAALVCCSCVSADAETSDVPAVSVTEQEGLEAWGRIFEVFSHPRCANCHVGTDNRPMWSGPSYGKARAHGMNINAGESRIGTEYLPCNSCHGLTNSPKRHGPPGAELWRLPPREFEWFGKTSAAICEQVRNPQLNGDRTISEIAEHVDHDTLLRWAWDPGPGREPAPYSLPATIASILEWGAAGGPCPKK